MKLRKVSNERKEILRREWREEFKEQDSCPSTTRWPLGQRLPRGLVNTVMGGDAYNPQWRRGWGRGLCRDTAGGRF